MEAVFAQHVFGMDAEGAATPQVRGLAAQRMDNNKVIRQASPLEVVAARA